MVARLRMPWSWQERRLTDTKRQKMGQKGQKLVMFEVDHCLIKLLVQLNLEKEPRCRSN